MKKVLDFKWLQIALRFFLGFIFIYAAIGKISESHEFAIAISNYQLFPDFSINFLAVFIPWLEIVCGFGLIFGVCIKENSFIYLSLITLFTLAVAISVFRGLDIECGCFGSEDFSKVGFAKIVENVVLIILALYIFISSLKDNSPSIHFK
jgi:uncharacterized membrane protein YphA (DoxX/SURF4 family)